MNNRPGRTSGGPFIALGALLAALGVGLGAFGAHGLRSILDAGALATFETAVRYQIYHALGLVLTGALLILPGLDREITAWLRRGGQLLAWGTLIFSGSLYLLLATGLKWFGAITPIGGVAFLLGWASLALAGLRMRRLPQTGA